MRKKYKTDLTDEQWIEIATLFVGTRNRKWEKRELVNAVLYLVDNGCKWRALPHDFPPYSTVHSFYRRARLSGLWDRILEHLVEVTRKRAKRNSTPSSDISEKIIPKEFKIIPKRWIVERTFAWLNNSRRLSKDYEILTSSEEAMVKISHIYTLLNRL